MKIVLLTTSGILGIDLREINQFDCINTEMKNEDAEYMYKLKYKNSGGFYYEYTLLESEAKKLADSWHEFGKRQLLNG